MEEERKYTRLLYGSTETYDLKCREFCQLDLDCVDCPCFEMAVQQLGEYEATGLSPEEVADMQTDWVVLKQLAEENKWVSVKARLPKPYQTVLVSDGAEVRVGKFCGESNLGIMCWKSDMDRSVITWWRPFPDPPEGDYR